MHNYHVPGDKMTVFGVDIVPIPNKPRRVLEWHYSIITNESYGYFVSDNLEGAIIHIIAVKNDRVDMTKAAALLLDVKFRCTGVHV